MKIELKNMKHVYPTGDEALKGINLVIEGTEPVAIIGQNGAGKTTIVKHFNGILRPTSGEVLINGEDINNRSTAKWSKEVGYVFQNPDDQLFLESVRKEFEFGPKQIGMPEDEIQKRIEWVAELVGLKDKLDMHPFDLTSTEKKFCTIGAIIMMDPKAVIFDEPTCGQDVAGNIRLREIIRQLKEDGKLCITISHDMKFVVEFNIFVDPEAAYKVFHSGIHVKMSGLNLTRQCCLTAEHVAEFRKIGTKAANLAADLTEFFIDSTVKSAKLTGANMHDACAVAWLINPNLIKSAEMHIDIELKGELTRGMTVCDYRHLRGVDPAIDLYREPQMDFRGEKPNAEAALELDFPGFMDLLYTTLRNYN